MVVVDPTIRDTQYTIKKPIVQIKSSLSDGWQTRPDMWVSSASRGIGQSIGQATLVLIQGDRIIPAGDDRFRVTPVSELDAERWWVRLVIEPNTPDNTLTEWMGIIVAEEQHDHGTRTLPNNRDSRDRIFRAYDTTWLLTRYAVTPKSLVARNEDVSAVDAISRLIPFEKNRSANGGPIPGDSFVFAYDTNSKTRWTVGQAVEYVLRVFGFGNVALTANGLSILNQFELPDTDITGGSIYDVLNLMVNTRRGLSWSIVRNFNAPLPIGIDVHTHTESSVSIGSGKTLFANANPRQIDCSHDPDGSVVVMHDWSKVYQQIKVVGGRRRACFTIGLNSSDALQQGWTATEQAAYLAGDSSNPSYATWGDRVKKERNDMARATDKMSHVFTRFYLPKYWSGITQAGERTCPILVDRSVGAAQTNTQIPMWVAGMRFDNQLLLRETWDYAGDPAFPAKRGSTDLDPPFREAFAVYVVPGSSPTRYVRSDRIGIASRNEAIGDNGIHFSSSLKMLENAGVAIVPSSLPHAQASGLWGGAAVSEVYPVLDYRSLVVTVCCEFDDHVIIEYPIAAGAYHNQESVLVIQMPESKLDFLVPGTVIDVDSRGDLVLAYGGYLQDDRPEMENIARLAWIWYGKQRRAANITYRQITDVLHPGDYLTTLDGVTSDTMVTSVSWDFLQGTTTIQTEFAEIDPLGFVA